MMRLFGVMLILCGWALNFGAAYWITGLAPSMELGWRIASTVMVAVFLGLVEGYLALRYLLRVAQREEGE